MNTFEYPGFKRVLGFVLGGCYSSSLLNFVSVYTILLLQEFQVLFLRSGLSLLLYVIGLPIKFIFSSCIKIKWLLSYELKRLSVQFGSVQSLSPVPLFVTPWAIARQSSVSITNSWNLLKLMSIELVMSSNHLILLSSSSSAFSFSQHQGLFKWISSSHQVAKVLEFQLQHQSFQWTLRTDLLWDGLVGSPCSPRNSQESSPTPHFKSINSSALSFLYSQLSHHTWLLEKP